MEIFSLSLLTPIAHCPDCPLRGWEWSCHLSVIASCAKKVMSRIFTRCVAIASFGAIISSKVIWSLATLFIPSCPFTTAWEWYFQEASSTVLLICTASCSCKYVRNGREFSESINSVWVYKGTGRAGAVRLCYIFGSWFADFMWKNNVSHSWPLKASRSPSPWPKKTPGSHFVTRAVRFGHWLDPCALWTSKKMFGSRRGQSAFFQLV